MSDFGDRTLRVAAAAAVGGTASELSGGKFTNGAVTGAFSRAFNDEVSHSLIARANMALKKLRGFPEFQEIETRAGELELTVDASVSTGYDPNTRTININPETLSFEFETVMSPLFEESLVNLSDEDYWNAIDSYPKWYRFSLERILYHEYSHALQPNSSLRYSLNPDQYELPVISNTNQFMSRNFQEPHRKNHTSKRLIGEQ